MQASQFAPSGTMVAAAPPPQAYYAPAQYGMNPHDYAAAAQSPVRLPPPTQGQMQKLDGPEGENKRVRRLAKNREAARECRRKKKEYVKCLEDRVQLLEQQNLTLIQEIKKLKGLSQDPTAPVGPAPVLPPT